MPGTRTVRRRALPEGWYPRSQAEIARLLESWKIEGSADRAMAVVAPHAGWHFSGRIAALALSSLSKPDTVAVIGGHLPASAPIFFATEDGFETPFGILAADKALEAETISELRDSGIPEPKSDQYADNCVEVFLPMIAFYFPGASVFWMRSPPNAGAKELGAALGRAASTLGRNLAVIGSTDLTHYGPAYGFSPRGSGMEAERWVREVNDKGFLDALLAMDADRVLAHAAKNRSACSSGAAAAACSFALERGGNRASLVKYSTSLDTHRDDSFVGYGAVTFR